MKKTKINDSIDNNNNTKLTTGQFSKYVLKLRIFSRTNKLLFEIYDNPCSIIVDESIISMIRKIAYMMRQNGYKNIDHTMIYIYTQTNYNILSSASITTPNILNEIIDDRTFNVSHQNLSDPIYIHIGTNIQELDIYVSTIYDEIEIIKNFYFGKIDDRLITDLYYNYIHVYFPILDIQIYKNIFSTTSVMRHDFSSDSISISKMQHEIEQIETIHSDDVEFLGESELKNLFLIFIPKFTSESIDNIEYLMSNMIFLDDLFLSIFESITTNEADTIIIQTPQLVAEKGIVTRSNLYTAPYRLTLKGRWMPTQKSTPSSSSSRHHLPLSYTLDFEPERCRVYLSYNGQTANTLTNENIEKFLYYICNLLSKDNFVNITYSKYTIDFFNVKVPVNRTISIDRIITIAKSLDEYLLVSKESKKSVYMKYRIGHVHNVLSGLYNKLFSMLNTNNNSMPSADKLLQLRIEYHIDADELMTIVNDVRMKVNSSYRERGISILISDSFINISGLGSIYVNNRIIFVINRILNLSMPDKKDAIIKSIKTKIQNEYIEYVTHLDIFIKNKLGAYWCKACQNYSKKIRKPIQYDSVPDNYQYDKSTNTYIDSAGHRIITLKIDNEDIHLGCDLRRSNPNKYIGFIKTCSLCCFQEDQFISKSRMAQRKITSCWLENKNLLNSNKKSKMAYIYTNAKMIGDICLIPDEFTPYFDEELYLFKLISVGALTLKPVPNELVFINSQIINPQMYLYDQEAYSIYIYDNPFLYKVISRHDQSNDTFLNTYIDDFIISCRRTFNTLAPLNAYNILCKHKKQIEKFSYIQDLNTCIFILFNKLVIAFIDKTLAFGEYPTMFGSNIRYVNKYDIPKLDDILDSISKYDIGSLLINTDGHVIGLSIYSTCFILFRTCTLEKFHSLTNNKFKNLTNTTNVAIASIVNQELKLASFEMLITDDIAEMYIYKMFRYQLYVYFNMNKELKQCLMDMYTQEPSARKRRENIFKLLNGRIANELFLTLDDKSNLKINKIEISNNISKSVLGCKYPAELVKSSSTTQCKLKITKDMQTRMIENITNELIFPYSSIYIYTSQFINNTYSPFSSMNNKLFESSTNDQYINDQSTHILNNGTMCVQEICPFDPNMDNMIIYRALANIYFWYKTRDEIDIWRRNLGYFSKSQTYLTYYIQSIVKIATTDIVKVLDVFNEKFNIQVTLQIDSSILRKADTIYHIYMSLYNGTISNISVGYDLSDTMAA